MDSLIDMNRNIASFSPNVIWKQIKNRIPTSLNFNSKFFEERTLLLSTKVHSLLTNPYSAIYFSSFATPIFNKIISIKVSIHNSQPFHDSRIIEIFMMLHFQFIIQYSQEISPVRLHSPLPVVNPVNGFIYIFVKAFLFQWILVDGAQSDSLFSILKHSYSLTSHQCTYHIK